MKIQIEYHSIEHGAHIFAIPSFTYSEIVEVSSMKSKKLQKHIESQTDEYGSSFKKIDDDFFGFQYTSNQGGVKVKEYVEPTPPTIIKL